MKIYIATDGEYSDYRIEAVFIDKEKAELFCATHQCYLETWNTCDTKIETDKKPLQAWSVEVIDGKIRNIYESNLTFRETIEKVNFRYGMYLITTQLGLTKKEATKIIADKYAKWKAERECL